jgi:AAA+ ATPase superfamily predicted ATPase
MDMFINREDELKALTEKLDSNNFEFIVIYGRRRIGKTKVGIKKCRK